MWPPLLPLLPLLHLLVVVDAQGILSFLNLGTAGTSRSVARPPSITDYTSQGLGLLNYFTSLQRNPVAAAPGRGKEVNLLGLEGVKGVPDLVGLPNANFLQGVPVVPGVAGSVPGVGECLPRGLPFITQRSPSMFQDFLRNIPGASDVLKSLVSVPDIDARSLMGKWYWVVTTPSVHTRFCSTSEFSKLVDNGKDSTFSIFDSFREGGEHGPPKIGFGYGLKNGRKVNVYTQQDPCPYQVVLVGPKSSEGQYEYVIMSNWAKYPVIGMVRDLNLYDTKYRTQIEKQLRQQGYINILTNMLGGSLEFVDWSTCQNSQVTTGNIVGNILNGLLFG